MNECYNFPFENVRRLKREKKNALHLSADVYVRLICAAYFETVVK